MAEKAKFLVSLIPVLIAGLEILREALTDGNVSQQEWVTLAVAMLSALLVYQVPNRSKHPELHRDESVVGP